MNNLIYRNQVIEAISELPVKVDNLGYTWMIAGDVLKQIDNIPSVELEERTAKVMTRPFGDIGLYKCINCQCYVVKSFIYCPRCGAKLNWSENE